MGGILAAPVRVMDQALAGPLALCGHHQGRECQLSAHVVSHSPANNLACTEVHHCGKVKPALSGWDVGDVCQPFFIRLEAAEVSVEQVFGDGEVVLAIGGVDPEFTLGDGEDVIVAHEFFDSSEAHFMAIGAKLGMDARAAIGRMSGMQGLDLKQQFCDLQLPCARLA